MTISFSAPVSSRFESVWLTSFCAKYSDTCSIKDLTLDEKISLLHGQGGFGPDAGPTDSNGGAGWSNAIPRVGIPAIQMADSAYGVTRGAASGRYSTALPNNLAAASSWDPQAAFDYGALIGRELRAQGYSMSLGGGVNLPREPRNGRTFEYQGEDPLLAGTLVGNFVKGVQSEHIIGDLKHYAINDQEGGRNAVNTNIDKRSMRETDLLRYMMAEMAPEFVVAPQVLHGLLLYGRPAPMVATRK